MTHPYDAVLIVSFGGPEGPEQVLPFLENVLRGKNVPRQRMLEVAEHYEHFGGVSPINAHNRALIAALLGELNTHGPRLPIYWGNRNWHPLLADTVTQMAEDGIRRASAFVTSAFSSYSSCRQYLEDIEEARCQAGPHAPEVDKLRAFFNHPGFIAALVDRVTAAFDTLPADRRARAALLCTAHSIPVTMANQCRYVAQLEETARLVAGHLGRTQWQLAFQSRSGPPQQAWLEPDILTALDQLHAAGTREVVIAPIGFLCDHLEVLYDLDVEAAGRCEQLGLEMVRAETVGNHPAMVRMIRDLIAERMTDGAERPALGTMWARPDVCPADCCMPPRGPDKKD